jgi:hypothetical protein
MVIVKASFTQSRGSAKASIRYIQHRPGKDGGRATRTLFGTDGLMGRYEAYRMIEEAEEGSHFFRLVVSPDPQREDTRQDLSLRLLTEHTMQALEERLQQTITWVAVVHADHAPHRHVHMVAVIRGRLAVQDLQVLRQAATQTCLQQRQERDQGQEQLTKTQEEAQWAPGS